MAVRAGLATRVLLARTTSILERSASHGLEDCLAESFSAGTREIRRGEMNHHTELSQRRSRSSDRAARGTRPLSNCYQVDLVEQRTRMTSKHKKGG